MKSDTLSQASQSPKDRLELRYVPLDQARRWDENPKRHDLDRIQRSIETHGFGDPPKFDATLDALVYGNGRTEALERMRAADTPPPRGILKTSEGDWAVPVIFGVDAKSRSAAIAFAIDHNNLTLMGGGLGFTDILHIWDEPKLQAVMADTPAASELLASFDKSDIDALLSGPNFVPSAEGDQSRLDKSKLASCPECGHEFKP